MEINYINEQTVMLYFNNEISEENYNQVNLVVQHIKDKSHPAIQDIVPSYRAILIYFNEKEISASKLIENLELNRLHNKSNTLELQQQRIITIPVVYGDEFGPDIEEVAHYNNITIEEVIETHVSKPYLIYMMGFMPGFPYLGGLDKRLHTPRRDEPRVKITAGSVGIANNQTGLYPLDSPGGWQIIGRTPVEVFYLNRQPMTLYEAGDYIQFKSISASEYYSIKDRIQNGKFDIADWVVTKNVY
ncbi:5-oxoprolinase subunit PxpB [Staphylococcus simiae]|uniref:Carboxyltransferase domain-containing protein n=1 Tax=Staphylococcus simiae CCM 7213 = CCUG 51256 TaxID=911238 RepID=G5JM93_9STAP|nr:5-oxoprolinase subunit PxpB [Staphylococcus simiae]EHJ06689.1 hypothetical protein SS7213T_13082 [Staphylococcus simiae CCM 7213 = CCUG 51256]PNZ14393.1 allophanate hydrolase subunit 1 [Staphylococcus simiae]SNV73602.1 Kinase autophosphorylation inhibitor [Staphylococcus simiae]